LTGKTDTYIAKSNLDYMADNNQSNKEYFRISGDDILTKIKEIIKEGNA
jgi:hypothetical protein